MSTYPLLIRGLACADPRVLFPLATDTAYGLRGYPIPSFEALALNERQAGPRGSLGHRAVDR